MKKLNIILILTITTFCSADAQYKLIGSKYSGIHTSTSYFFEFISDSTVVYSGYGHGGFGRDTARYHFQTDTLIIESRMIKKEFLIKGNYIINIYSQYDYKKVEEEEYKLIKKGYALHNSRKFSIKYPQLTAIDSYEISELENILKITFELDTIQQFLLKQKELIYDHKIRVLDYYQLEPFSITTTNFEFELSLYDQFRIMPYYPDNVFIYIRDINFNPNKTHLCFDIVVNQKLYVTASIYFDKKENIWNIQSENYRVMQNSNN